MANGMIYVEDPIFLQQEKLAKLLNLQKFQEHIGEEIQIMKCCREYMEPVGVIKKELDEYLLRLEEAEKRDHRKLGKKWIYFIFEKKVQEQFFGIIRVGLYFKLLVGYMRKKQKQAGYKEINTPEILDKTLWEQSGHWEKFGENMFTSETPDEKTFCN